MNRLASRLPAIVEQHQTEILADWVKLQLESGAWRAGRLQESQLRDESQRFLSMLSRTLASSGNADTRSASWSEVRDFLAELSRPGLLAFPGRDIRFLSQAAAVWSPAPDPG
jgi:hypothetical protein